MHSFLRAIGFKEVKDRKDLNKFISKVKRLPKEEMMYKDGPNVTYGERSYYVGNRIGITFRGYYDDSGRFVSEYYFPFLKANENALNDRLIVEKQPDKDSFIGVSENAGLSIPLIFYLGNMMEYLNSRYAAEESVEKMPIAITALSYSGKVILPVKKSSVHADPKAAGQKALEKVVNSLHNTTNPDKLMLDYMDACSMVLKRLKKHEDVLSIVESYFMPYGISCDQYSAMGEILHVDTAVNCLTGESSYILKVNSNGLIFDICINEQDLMGEPLPGRRFKGDLWLMGYGEF